MKKKMNKNWLHFDLEKAEIAIFGFATSLFGILRNPNRIFLKLGLYLSDKNDHFI